MRSRKECLTKENFWDEAMGKYPLAVTVFCEWIDKYKEKVGWNNLFGYTIKGFNPISMSPTGLSGTVTEKEGRVKYHDLPIAMQFGVYLEFVKMYPMVKFTPELWLYSEEPAFYIISYHLEQLNKHFEKETYPCKVCGKPFKNYDDLYEHYDTVHNKGEKE